MLNTTKGNKYDLMDEDVLLNNPVFSWESNPHRVRLWVIGHEYGPIVALWADSEQEAFDEMLDKGYEQFLVAPEDVDEEALERGEYAHLGNAGEPCDLSYAWIEEVVFEPARDIKLIVQIAEGRGAGNDTLWS